MIQSRTSPFNKYIGNPKYVLFLFQLCSISIGICTEWFKSEYLAVLYYLCL